MRREHHDGLSGIRANTSEMHHRAFRMIAGWALEGAHIVARRMGSMRASIMVAPHLGHGGRVIARDDA
jgi:hypothetical protein